MEYLILVDSNEEANSLESIFSSLGATSINQEGWTTAYGGTGIKMWIKMPALKGKRRGMSVQSVIASCKTASLLKKSRI